MTAGRLGALQNLVDEYCGAAELVRDVGRVAPGGKVQRLPPYASPGDNPHMLDYRRNRVPGGTYFAVNPLERKLSLLNYHAESSGGERPD